MNIKLNYGLRMVRAHAIGAVLFVIAMAIVGTRTWPFGAYALGNRITDKAVLYGWFPFAAAVMCFICRCGHAMLMGRGKIAAALFAPIWFVYALLAGCLGLWFFIGICMVIGTPEILHAWQKILKAIGVTYVIPLTALWLVPLIVMAKEHLLENTTFQRWFLFGAGGSARWAGPATFATKLCTWRKIRGRVVGACIMLGYSRFEDDFCPRLMSIKDDGHHIVLGQPGSGKSTTFGWPNLKAYQGSAFVLDPKGEHFIECSGDRSGGALFDPYNEAGRGGTTYNPLCEIDIESDDARPMLSAISDALILKEGGTGTHFVDCGRLLLEGAVAHVKSSEPPENQNLPYIFDLLQGINADGFADPEALDATLIDMRMNPVAGGIAQAAAATLEAMGQRERGSVLSTLQRSLKWVSDPAMRRQLADSDFRYASLVKEEGSTAWIVLPPRMMTENVRWLRLHVNIAIRVIEAQKAKPKNKVLMVLDEFPKLRGSLEAVEDGIVTLRSAKISLVPMIQSISQLVRDYPKNWSAFIAASTVHCFGVSDMQTAEFISKLLGEKVVSRKERIEGKRFRKRIVHEMPRPLMTPTEVIKELQKNSSMQIVIPNTGNPMRLTRVAHKSIKVEGRRFHAMPAGWQLAML